MKGKVLFRETQTFRGVPFYAIITFSLLAILIPVYYRFFDQVVLGNKTSETSETSYIILVLFVTLIVIGILVFVYVHKLEIEIDESIIRYRLSPYHSSFKTIKKEKIKEIYVRKYSPVYEYGGWGLRWSLFNGKAYNIWGNKGLQIVFTNNKKLLIGTQKPEELNNIVEDWKKEKKYG